MSSLIHCVYCSAATRPFTAADLGELLRLARLNNAQAGLTGMLLYAEGAFFQVLEGPGEAVDSLYRKIELDTRHAQMTRIIHEPIRRRLFDDWTMGFSTLSREELETIPGTNDFFGEGKCFVGLDAGRAKKLLAAFRSGRWRQTLSGAPRPDPVVA
ncbi:MAG: BLUF domain-containing protein [Betaproteobacteria bacterium]